MERLFSATISSKPGTKAVQPVQTPGLMMLRGQHSAGGDLVKAVLGRFQMDDESSSVQTVGYLLNLSLEGKIPGAMIDDTLQSVVEFGQQHTSWGDTLRGICALVHYHCHDLLTIAQLADIDAMDVATAALVNFRDREDVTLAACVMLEHFTCCTFKAQTLEALRAAITVHPSNPALCRAAVASVTNATTYWGGGSDPAPLVDAFIGTDSGGVNPLIGVMKGCLSDTASTVLCVRALANFAAHSRDGSRAFVVHTVLETMAQHADSEDVASQGLGFLANGASAPDVHSTGTLDTVLNMLPTGMQRASAGHTRILTDVIHTLGAFATHWKDSKPRMSAAGVVATLLEIMKTYNKDAVLQQQCCNLLSYLCFDSEAITQAVTRSGGVALVLRAMGIFRDNEQLLTAACAAISGLTFNNPAGQAVVKEADAVPLLLTILRSATRPRLVEMACLALGTLCWNPELKQAIAEERGIELVIEALEKHASASGVVKNACRALAQIAFNSEKYRDDMTTRGAIRLIIAGMSNHPQHDRAQLHACAALSYLSWTSPQNAAEILKHGGYRAIIRAMSHNLPNHEVQEHACRALANISGAPPDDTEAALQAIVDAMHRHDRISEVQEEACRAIVTLALAAPENKTKLHERNVSNTVVNALRRFPSVPLVQQEAANAVAHLAYEHPELNRAITELDAVALLVSAMRSYPANSKLQLNACGGLSALAFNNQVAQKQVSDLGGVPYILKAMRDFDRVRILELGCSLLGTLAWNPAIKEKVAEACVPTIIATMRNHPDNACLQKATIRAAAQFAFDSEKNRVLLYEASAVGLIVRALHEHMSNSKLVGHALVALTYLCWENGDIASAILESDALDVVEEVMRVHGSCDRVAGRAQHLRRILQRRTTPTSGEVPEFPVGSPVLPYGRSFNAASPPGSPTSPGPSRGGRGGRPNAGGGNHSPFGPRGTPSFPTGGPSFASATASAPRGGRASNAERGGRATGGTSTGNGERGSGRGGRGGDGGGRGYTGGGGGNGQRGGRGAARGGRGKK